MLSPGMCFNSNKLNTKVGKMAYGTRKKTGKIY